MGKQILAPGHQENAQRRAFCVLVTEEQKGLCASLSLGDGRASQCNWTRSGGRHCVRSPLLPRLHNSLSDSPKSARRDYQAEKRNQAATVIYSNPGSRFYVIIGMISQLAHSGQQAIIALFTPLHTHTHSCSHTFSLLDEMAKKVLVFHSLPVFFPHAKFLLLNLFHFQSHSLSVCQGTSKTMHSMGRACTNGTSVFSVSSGA